MIQPSNVCVGTRVWVCVSVPVWPLLLRCPLREYCSRFSLWELPTGIHRSRVNWSGGVLRKVPQAGTAMHRQLPMLNYLTDDSDPVLFPSGV